MILIQHLDYLRQLIKAIDGNQYFGKNRKKRYDNYFIIENVKLFINYENKYAGAYYTYKSQKIWIGYTDSFGFCVSFLMNKNIKTKLIKPESILRKQNITYVFEYADINNGEYWITIPLSQLKQISPSQSTPKLQMFEIISDLMTLIPEVLLNNQSELQSKIEELQMKNGSE